MERQEYPATRLDGEPFLWDKLLDGYLEWKNENFGKLAAGDPGSADRNRAISDAIFRHEDALDLYVGRLFSACAYIGIPPLVAFDQMVAAGSVPREVAAKVKAVIKRAVMELTRLGDDPMECEECDRVQHEKDPGDQWLTRKDDKGFLYLCPSCAVPLKEW